MTRLRFKQRDLELQQYESVLDCLLRHGEAIPYACKAGMCQACLIRAVDCEATAESRKWIKPALQQQGFTLACQWVPDSDVAAELPSVEDFSIRVRIAALEALNARTMKVLLQVPDPATMFAYRPGQYLTLINPAGVARSYSIANDYQLDGHIELHISATRHGMFTNWLFSQAAPGDELHMRGPAGDCFYIESEAAGQPLLLAGTGSGLAPLYGIARDALGRGHDGPVILLHGGRSPEHLYYVDELRRLAAQHPGLRYIPCAVETEGAEGIAAGSVEEVMARELDDKALPGMQIYLCGAPDFVHGLRKRLFLKGARSANIHCDPFTERSVAGSDTEDR